MHDTLRCAAATGEHVVCPDAASVSSVASPSASSEESSVRVGRTGGLRSHVAREQLILCAHSACRQAAGHNGSYAGNNTNALGPVAAFRAFLNRTLVREEFRIVYLGFCKSSRGGVGVREGPASLKLAFIRSIIFPLEGKMRLCFCCH